MTFTPDFVRTLVAPHIPEGYTLLYFADYQNIEIPEFTLSHLYNWNGTRISYLQWSPACIVADASILYTYVGSRIEGFNKPLVYALVRPLTPTELLLLKGEQK